MYYTLVFGYCLFAVLPLDLVWLVCLDFDFVLTLVYVSLLLVCLLCLCCLCSFEFAGIVFVLVWVAWLFVCLVFCVPC